MTTHQTNPLPHPDPSDYYFTQETEDHIIAYNREPDAVRRSVIYERHIHRVFEEMIEKINHRYGYTYRDGLTIKELRHEVICVLVEKMHRYDPSKGKAYSYFGTITRRYLMSYNKASYKKLLAKIDWDDEDEEYAEEPGYEEPDWDAEPPETFTENFLCFLEEHPSIHTKYEKLVASGFIQIVRAENVTFLDRKFVLIYLRELLPHVSEQKIYSTLKKIKGVYREFLNDKDE